jgi:uncharacterized protein (TIGR00297 family)
MAPPRQSLQSRLVLLAVVPAAAALLPVLFARTHSREVAWGACGVGLALAALTLLLRAATPWAAALGALIAACCALAPPGLHSSLVPLLLTLVLTLGATRVARRAGPAVFREGRPGRTSAQVAANLGVAALAPALTDRFGQLAALTALLAALAEAAADTVSSELGQLWGGTPRLLTTLKPAPPGTDGAISTLGTVLGAVAAALVALGGLWIVHFSLRSCAVAAGAGVAGLLFDSLLGATLERAGVLENDAVNFLSTAFAALLALCVAVGL